MTINKKAEKYFKYFKTDKRTDGTEFIKLENEPVELHNSVMNAHEGKLPDDWIYRTYADLLERITEYDLKTIDDLNNVRHEIVDGYVDIYTADLTGWLHEDINNVYYLEQAMKEYEPSDGFQLLSMAQYIAIDEIFSYVYDLLSK